MTRFARVVARLLVLQSSWTYERMQGVGTGFASLPLLESLRGDGERHRAAVARSVEYFNAHPYLAGIAIGAAARAEEEGVAPATIQRLKTALAGPLGAIGDQLFWIGVVPAVMAAMLLAVALGADGWGVMAGVGGYLIMRLLVTAWSVRLGYRAGINVSHALKASGLAQAVQRVGVAAAFLVGCAVAVLGQWLAVPGHAGAAVAVGAGVLGGGISALVQRRLPTPRTITLGVMAAVLLWHWSTT